MKSVRGLSIERRMSLYHRGMELRGARGWSAERIARELKVPEGAVKGWLYYDARPDRRCNYIRIRPSPALSYVIGVFHGDGWIQRSGKMARTIGLTVKDEDFLDEFNTQLCQVLRKQKRYSKVRASDERMVVCGYSQQLYDFLDRGLEHHKKVIERHPTKFLRGLFDSDGGGGQGQIYCWNTNITLLHYAKELLENLGIDCKILKEYEKGSSHTIKKKGWKGTATKDCFKLHITGENNIKRFLNKVGFSIGRKRRASSSTGKERYQKNKEREQQYAREYYRVNRDRILARLKSRSIVKKQMEGKK